MRLQKVVLCVVVVLQCATTYAQLNRSAVSITGSDSNPCTPAAPCRSIAYALTQTSSGGELIALTSGGYGPFVVSKSATIEAAPGIYAGITATSGTAISISAGASDTVVLRGLTVNSLGAASGIGSGGGAKLYVEQCTIHDFPNEGILSFFSIAIVDTTIRNCGFAIQIDNAGAAVNAVIDHVFIAGGGFAAGPLGFSRGVFAWRNSHVAVSNTVVADVYFAFSAHDGGELNLEKCVATHDYTGIWAGPVMLGNTGGFVRVSNTMSVENTYGLYCDPAGTLESWGNNRSRGNTAGDVVGTLSPVTSN
jgi:hypothetical protein